MNEKPFKASDPIPGKWVSLLFLCLYAVVGTLITVPSFLDRHQYGYATIAGGIAFPFAVGFLVIVFRIYRSQQPGR